MSTDELSDIVIIATTHLQHWCCVYFVFYIELCHHPQHLQHPPKQMIRGEEHHELGIYVDPTFSLLSLTFSL